MCKICFFQLVSATIISAFLCQPIRSAECKNPPAGQQASADQGGTATGNRPTAEANRRPTAQSSLNGEWLIESAEVNGRRRIEDAWYSKLTIRDGNLSVSRFFGSLQTMQATFKVTASAPHDTIEVQTPAIELTNWIPNVTLSASTLQGIVKLSKDTLTICLGLEPEAQRPQQFASTDERTVLLSFKRAAAFIDFPDEVTVTVVDASGKPVAGAQVFKYMLLRRYPEEQDAEIPWNYVEYGKTGPNGALRIPYEDLNSYAVMARDPKRHLIDVATLSPAALQQSTAKLTLQPEHRIHGTIGCNQLGKLHKPIGETSASLFFAGQLIAVCSDRPGEYEFFVPSGRYAVEVDGGNVWSRRIQFSVSPEQRVIEVPPVDVRARNHVLLEGQLAPELEGILGWRHAPLKLADLKGRYTIVYFWGTWCIVCLGEMEKMIRLHEQFHEQGLEIIGVHVNADDDQKTLADLQAEVDGCATLWGGKHIPFPMAFAASTPKIERAAHRARTAVAEQYGIAAYPTAILIDREGKIVGRFDAHPESKAVATLTELLKKE